MYIIAHWKEHGIRVSCMICGEGFDLGEVAYDAVTMERVLEFRHRSSAAGYRMNLDLDNIEHLFSLAAAKSGSATAEDIRLAIAATLDFTAQTGTQPIARLRISEAEGWPCTSLWRTAATRWVVGSDGGFDDVGSSVYDYYAALLSGLDAGQANMEANTVITFNYDLLLEESLRGYPKIKSNKSDSYSLQTA